MRLAFQVLFVVAIVTVVVFSTDRLYESYSLSRATKADTIVVRKAAIIQAYATMARAIPGVEVEADQARHAEYEVLILVYVDETHENALESLATLANLLPITECGGKIEYLR